ncbi:MULTISPECIES: SusC/RagA family TonB-linked outer membrane protein [Chitinophagaceae]
MRKQLRRLTFSVWLLFPCIVFAQLRHSMINGKVVTEKGNPLQGASIVLINETNHKRTVTTSNEEGKFVFDGVAVNQKYTLMFDYIGFQRDSVTRFSVTSDIENNSIVMRLKEAEAKPLLSEVVVVGYGTQKKENLTGAVAQVKMADVLGDRPVINTTSALQGAVPGLQITRVATPGQNNNTINIRGTLSINGGSPLILIDNVPGEIDMLNPEDIESVTVLKDAASAAIYGARAAGGVIIITTKRPKSNARFQVSYNNNFGSEVALGTPVQSSLDQYLSAYIDAGFNDKYWASSQSVTQWRDYLRRYKANPSAFNLIGDGIYVDSLNSIYYLNEKNLYSDFLNNGFLQSHNLAVSGGTDKVRFRMSAGYDAENGPLLTNKDYYKRLSTSAFISADMTPWYTQELDIKYAQATKRMPTDEAGGLYSLRLVSYYPEGNMPGSLMLNTTTDYPLNTPKNIVLNSNTNNTIVNTPRISFRSIFKPIKGLEGVFEYTYNKSDTSYSYYSGEQVYSNIQLATTTSPTKDYYVRRRYFADYSAFNAYVTYIKSVGEHNFKLMGGAAQESRYYENIYNYAESQALLSTPSFAGATGTVTNTDSYSEYSLQSLFYRLNYNFNDKYLVEFNGRYDGSSKFPPKHRFGFFPSASVGWQIGKEKFMDGVRNWLTEFKIRASYGSIGNQNINPYQFSPTMSVNKSNVWAANQDLVTVIGVPGLVSDNFTWETVTTADVGVDISLLKNRLQGTFDWYQRDTKNMLSAGMAIPSVIGASAPLQNTADMRTRGFELAVSWRDRIGEFGYRVGFNLYSNNSWITKYITNTSGLLSDYYVGQHLGEIWGYVTDGYYSVNDFADLNTWKLKDGVASIKGYNVKPGDVKFKNLMDDDNSTNQIDAGLNTTSNPGDRKIIGNTTPKYQFGANLGFNYKGFDLNIMLQGVGKRDYWVSGQSIFPFAGSGATDAVFQPLYYNQTDYWKPKSTDPSSSDYMVAVNPNAKLFRIYDQMGNVGSNTRTSDKYLQSAAYLRVKNVTLSYTLPKKMLQKASISSLRVFVGVENLATFTSLPKGYDPEPATLSWTYPFYRTVTAGLSLTL